MQSLKETSSFNTYYDILGIRPIANQEEIHQAYLVQIDKNPLKRAKLKQIFDILSDVEKRASYDKRLSRCLRIFDPHSPERAYAASRNKPSVLISTFAPLKINEEFILAEYQRFTANERKIVLLSLLKGFLLPNAKVKTAREKYLKLFEQIFALDYLGCARVLLGLIMDDLQTVYIDTEPLYKPGSFALFLIKTALHKKPLNHYCLKEIEHYFQSIESIPKERNFVFFSASENTHVTYYKSICDLYNRTKSACKEMMAKEPLASEAQHAPPQQSRMWKVQIIS